MRIKILLSAVAAVILSAAGAGIAWASIPDGGGVIHGCYKTPVPAHGSPLSVVDTGAGGTCPSGYAPLTWNQAGPPGPAGPAGPQGAAGVSGYQVVSNVDHNPQPQASGPLSNGGIYSLSADCPSGTVPLGGGGSFTWDNFAGAPVANMSASVPTATGWSVTWYENFPGLSGTRTATVYATCAAAG